MWIEPSCKLFRIWFKEYSLSIRSTCPCQDTQQTSFETTCICEIISYFLNVEVILYFGYITLRIIFTRFVYYFNDAFNDCKSGLDCYSILHCIYLHKICKDVRYLMSCVKLFSEFMCLYILYFLCSSSHFLNIARLVWKKFISKMLTFAGKIFSSTNSWWTTLWNSLPSHTTILLYVL